MVDDERKPKCKSELFCLYLKIQKSDEDESYIYVLDDSTFEAVSKRAWTDVLIQIYKVRWISLYSHKLDWHHVKLLLVLAVIMTVQNKV